MVVMRVMMIDDDGDDGFGGCDETDGDMLVVAMIKQMMTNIYMRREGDSPSTPITKSSLGAVLVQSHSAPSPEHILIIMIKDKHHHHHDHHDRHMCLKSLYRLPRTYFHDHHHHCLLSPPPNQHRHHRQRHLRQHCHNQMVNQFALIPGPKRRFYANLRYFA